MKILITLVFMLFSINVYASKSSDSLNNLKNTTTGVNDNIENSNLDKSRLENEYKTISLNNIKLESSQNKIIKQNSN